MWRNHYCCQILINLELCWQMFDKYSNIKFHENTSSESRVFPCRQTDMTKLLVAYRNFANAPKNHFCFNFDNLFLFQVWSETIPKAFPSVFTYCREFYSSACWCGWWNTCGYLAGNRHWGPWLIPWRRDSFDCRWMSMICLDIQTWQFCIIQEYTCIKTEYNAQIF